MVVMGKKIKIIRIILGALLVLMGIFYLFFPHSIHTTLRLDFGLEHYRHILLGGFLLIVGVILSLNGKRLLQGIFAKGWKTRRGITIIMYILTFAFLFLWFNSGFELFAGDVNNLKMTLFTISSVALSIFLLVGMINAKKIFGLKSTRY